MKNQLSLEPEEPRVNMAENERQLSLLGGMIFLAVAFLRRGWLGLGFGSMGASLIYQSITGVSPINQLLNKNRAVHDPSARISVPHQQGSHLSASTIIHRPVEEIYAFLRDFNNLPLFMPYLKSVMVQDEQRSRWSIHGPLNKVLKWDIEVVNDEPNEVVAWRTISNPYVSHAGAIRLSPMAMEQGTEVRIEMEYMPLGGKMAAMLLDMLGQSPEDEISHGLWRLKQLLEVGEVSQSTNMDMDSEQS